MLIDQDELLEKLGYERPADLRKRLDTLHIPYMLGKGGRIVTTTEAINHRLIGGENPKKPVKFT